MRPVEELPTNGLLRIQNEISEVEKRELELRHEHELMSPRSSFSGDGDHERSTSPQNFNSKDQFKKNKIIEPQPKPQLLAPPALIRAQSTPQLFLVSPVKLGSPHRGIMAKFIASRGKLNVNQVNQPSTQNSNNFKKNLIMAPIEFNNGSIKAFHNMEKAAIERDTKGRPIRRGYVPVEEKIQSELRDLKNRENELKRLHKIGGGDDDGGSSASSDESDHMQQHWSPLNGKLSRSIDVLNNPSPSPTSDAHRPVPQPRNGNYMRPAVSLAALCDLDSESETPSSHKLIERWESIIQENQKREKSYNLH